MQKRDREYSPLIIVRTYVASETRKATRADRCAVLRLEQDLKDGLWPKSSFEAVVKILATSEVRRGSFHVSRWSSQRTQKTAGVAGVWHVAQRCWSGRVPAVSDGKAVFEWVSGPCRYPNFESNGLELYVLYQRKKRPSHLTSPRKR